MLFSLQGSRTFSILSYNNNRSNSKHVLKQRKVVPPLPAMNGGDGDLSYSQNSAYQRGAVEAAEEIIKSEVVKQFSVKKLCGFPTQTSFRIADFGCSTGPNTFLAVQIIINAIIKKLETESQNSKLPEFQVFFNDNVFNDFNTLFSSLPPERNYYASGVPGSFYIPLFPKASLHFAHSSSALCWLSELPKEITDRSSRAWNKGKISYTESKEEVFEAYSGQFCRDFERFLNARADELVSGGLMELLVPGVPDDLDQSHSTTASEIDLLGSCLMDMANNVNTLICPNERL
ncbi:hypothetical protein Leryth_018650 [Lithospermum erythrorhizon]|nr:hypothetical protein Leryth_018650 [Lithospermum erythrorhizon]